MQRPGLLRPFFPTDAVANAKALGKGVALRVCPHGDLPEGVNAVVVQQLAHGLIKAQCCQGILLRRLLSVDEAQLIVVPPHGWTGGKGILLRVTRLGHRHARGFDGGDCGNGKWRV